MDSIPGFPGLTNFPKKQLEEGCALVRFNGVHSPVFRWHFLEGIQIFVHTLMGRTI